MARIQTSPAAIEALGAPITDNLFFTGQIKVNNSDGDANLQIGVKGSRGKGTAYVIANRSFGHWHCTQLIPAIHDSPRRIDLSDPEKTKTGPLPER